MKTKLEEWAEMKIENKEVTKRDIYSPVTYVPGHAYDNAGHPDCEPGVIISFSSKNNTVRVLYCNSRTIKQTNANDLVWG